MPQLAASKLDHAGRVAILHALSGPRVQGEAFQVLLRVGQGNVCVNAVVASQEGRYRFRAAAARRAAAGGGRLLRVVDTGEFEQCLWIAYEVGSCIPLAERRSQLLLPTAICLRLLSGVARALDQATRQGIHPHEVRPEYVFVTGGDVRLGDLGTARAAVGGPRSEAAYVPPEVLGGEPAGERSGVYAFGALLYELLAGASPRRGPGAGGALMPLAGRRPHLPPAIDSVVAATMAEDPRQRPRSAVEAYELVRRVLRPGGPDAPQASGVGPEPLPDAPRDSLLDAPPEPRPSASWSDLARLLPIPERHKPSRGASPTRSGERRKTANKPRPQRAEDARPGRAAAGNGPTTPAPKARTQKPSTQPATPPKGKPSTRSPNPASAKSPATPEPSATPKPSATPNPAPRATPASGPKPPPAATRPPGAIRSPAESAAAPPPTAATPPTAPTPSTTAARSAAAKSAAAAPPPTAPTTAAPTSSAPTRAFPPAKSAAAGHYAGPAKRFAGWAQARPDLRGAPSPPWLLAAAVGGALLLGAVAGMLLGSSSDPGPARAKLVEAAGLGLATPPSWQLADPGSAGTLAVRSGGDSPARLEVRLAEGPHEPPSSAEGVQLGALQAWRTTAPGVMRYSAPTSRGTLLISCRTSPAADSRLLRECERTASTVRLRGATALPLRDAVDREERLRATVATLRAERDAGRERLARATRRRGQSAVARSLARSHKRAAATLAKIPGADPIEAAARAAASAYVALAEAAASGKRDRWQRAREGVDRQDAALADVLTAAG